MLFPSALPDFTAIALGEQRPLSENPWYALIRNAVRAIERGHLDQARRISVMVLAYSPKPGGPAVRAARVCARALMECLDADTQPQTLGLAGDEERQGLEAYDLPRAASGSGFGPQATAMVAAQALADAVGGVC